MSTPADKKIKTWQRAGAAVLCVTHDRADAAALGAEIVEI